MTRQTHYEYFIERMMNPLRASARKHIAAGFTSVNDYIERVVLDPKHPIIRRALKAVKVYDEGDIQIELSREITAFIIERIAHLFQQHDMDPTFSGFVELQKGNIDDFDLHLIGMLMKGETRSEVESSLSLLFTLYCHVLQFEKHSKRTYEVTPALHTMLAATQLKGVRCDDLRLPYKSIFVLAPENCTFKVWNDVSGWHLLRGLYVYEDRISTDSDRWGIVGGARCWRIMACGEDKAGTHHAIDDALSYWTMPLVEGRPIDEMLDAMAAHVDELATMGYKGIPRRWRPIFEWLMNTILYVTWKEPGEHIIQNKEARALWERAQRLPKRSKKRARLSERLRGMDTSRRAVLGSKIVIQRRNGQSEAESESGQINDKQRVARMIPGHWRHQAHGPKWTLRKWKWIEPYWRGRGCLWDGGKVHEVR